MSAAEPSGDKHHVEAPENSHSTREEEIDALNDRLKKLENARDGESIRLMAMFLLGVSAGISLTLLYIQIMREFF